MKSAQELLRINHEKLTLSKMENEKPEFFKLDAIDREVLLWTITHAPRSLQSWIDYVAVEYKKKIDRDRSRKIV